MPLPEPAIDRWLPNWWTWTLHVQIGMAVLLVVSLVLREASYRRQRERERLQERHGIAARLSDAIQAPSAGDREHDRAVIPPVHAGRGTPR